MSNNTSRTKVCTVCGKEFPATREFFTANKLGRYGLHSRCLKCHSQAGSRTHKGELSPLQVRRQAALEEMHKLPKIEGVERIFLESKFGKWQHALVDECQFQELSKFRWFVSGGYVRRSPAGAAYPMHWCIMGKPPEGYLVDHINGNTLDNRRANLRFVDKQANARNRGGNLQSAKRFKGVFAEPRGIYRARIWVDGKGISVGSSRDEVTAARYYDAAARHFFGEHARLNLPDLSPLPVRLPRNYQ